MEFVRTFVVNNWEVKIAFNEPDKTSDLSRPVETTAAPGAGKYQISSLRLLADKISPGNPLKLSAQINGENIAFLYTEIFIKDEEKDYYYGPLTQQYVHASVEKEVNGLVHPIWESEISLSLEIKPVLRVLTNGIDAAFAFMHPDGYATESYNLEGLYTKKRSGNSNRANLKFDISGELIDKHIIQEKRGRMLTHDLVINMGDLFIPAVHILTSGNLTHPKMHSLHGISGTVTKLEDSFRCVEEAAIPGEYLLGLVIEDFDGGKHHHYLPFTIEDDGED